MTPVHARPAWIRWLAWILGLLAALLALLHLWFAGNILWWRDHPVGETSFMTYRLDQLREKNPKAQLHYAWVPYAKISNNLKRAMVAAEDAKFVEHEGFDWDGIQLAMEKNQKKGRVVAGGSTITQQLAKNLFLSRRAQLLAQGGGSGDHRDARGDAAEAAHPRDLSQRDRMGQRDLRRRGGGDALFRRIGGAIVAGAGGAARRDGAQPALLRAQPQSRIRAVASRRFSRGCSSAAVPSGRTSGPTPNSASSVTLR